MNIIDARKMPLNHEDLIVVTDTSIYYRQHEDDVTFSIYRYDLEDGEITTINHHPYHDYGISKLFSSNETVYLINEKPGRRAELTTELIELNIRTGVENTIFEFDKQGNSTLYWVLADRYFVFLTEYEQSTEAWMYDRETGKSETIRDERLVGKSGRFRELYLFYTTFGDEGYIVCNARLDEFYYYEALEAGVISPDDPFDHSEAILVCPLEAAVNAIWNGEDELPFKDVLRLQGEGDTVQYLGEQDGNLRFAAFVDILNQETIYELVAPDQLQEVSTIDWGAYEPLDFTYDDVASSIFIKIDETEKHTEVVDAMSEARYVDTHPFERVLEGHLFIHESVRDNHLAVAVFNSESGERRRFEDAYYTVVDRNVVILSSKQ